jgi:hypothetical protein
MSQDGKLKLLATVIERLNAGTQKHRDELDQNIHELDVSYGAVRHSKPPYVTEKEFVRHYEEFQQALNYLDTSNTIMGAVRVLLDPDVYKKHSVVYVPSKDVVLGLTYAVLQRKLASIIKIYVGKNKTDERNVLTKFIDGIYQGNIGHSAAGGYSTDSSYTSPLSLMISSGLKGSSPMVRAELQKSLKALAEVHLELQTEFIRDSNVSNKVLGKYIVRTAWQSNQLNAITLRKKEVKIVFKEQLLNSKSSNSIKEDLVLAIKQVILPKTVIPKHTRTPALKGSVDASSKVTGKTTSGAPAQKRLRAVESNKVISLVTIQQLINGKLRDQIQNNMGKGKAKTILNYRTGRFADSVRVTKLARTKEDEVTAFYTYMKYPYQTFEPGFAQGQIATRDPKLLISKSIRDVAKDIVTARLKAVLV